MLKAKGLGLRGLTTVAVQRFRKDHRRFTPEFSSLNGIMIWP